MGLVESTEVTFSWICYPGRQGKLFQGNCLTSGFMYHGWWEGDGNRRRDRIDMCIRERKQISVEELISGAADPGNQSSREMAGSLQSPSICPSELPELPVLRRHSENSQRDVNSHKDMIS